MTKKTTEREKVLIQHIQNLLGIISFHNSLFSSIANGFRIMHDTSDKINSMLDSSIEYLDSEFDIKFTKIKSDEKEQPVTETGETQNPSS